MTCLLSTGRYLAIRRASVIRRRDQEWTETMVSRRMNGVGVKISDELVLIIWKCRSSCPVMRGSRLRLVSPTYSWLQEHVPK